jgi:hypothetical protein
VESAPPDRDRRLRQALPLLRVALVAFVLLWLFGPYELRAAVPVWLPFLVALGLELQFFAGVRRGAPAGRETRGRLPQAVDRERYGYAEPPEDMLLVRDGAEELWIPYSGEQDVEVANLIAEARERAELEAAAPPAPPLEHSRRPPVRQLLAGLAVLAALGALVWYVDSRSGWNGLGDDARARTTARLSAEASRIAAHRVEIRCDEGGTHVGAVQHADGVAVVGGRLSYLTPDRCFDLYRLAFHGDVRSSQTGRSLAVLAHESWHLRGVRDEATTECYALQSGVALGRRLGLSEGRARELMRQQLVENELRGGRSLEYRVSDECRNGGRLDLRPTSSDFP